MTDILGVCGAGLCALFAVLVLRELRSEYRAALILGFSVLFMMYIVPRALESVDFIKEAAAHASSAYISVMLRGLGITYLTSVSGEICRSSGEGAIAGYIETAGRVEILLLCVPLFRELLEIALL